MNGALINAAVATAVAVYSVVIFVAIRSPLRCAQICQTARMRNGAMNQASGFTENAQPSAIACKASRRRKTDPVPTSFHL